MRKLCVVFCVMLVFVMGGTALAGEMKPSVSLGGQLAMPMGDFGDLWKMGFGGNGRFGMQFSPKLEAGVTVGYSSLSFDEDGALIAMGLAEYEEYLDLLGITVGASGGDMTMIEIISDIKFFIPVGTEDAPFKPYLTGVAGINMVSIDDLSMEFASTVLGMSVSFDIPAGDKTAAIFGVGAGFEYMFSPKAGFWVDAKYMLSNLKIAVIASEYDVQYLPIRAGVKIMFGGTE